ncbi:MAG TPA: hypothetical protein VKC63_12685 [Solirubrobacterales bacterium]|nr:hypothetical protein [Solirubrobacterales bacterium]
MREKLNSNPLAQIAVVGVLLIAVGFFVMSSGGGGGEEESSGETEATVSVAGTTATGTATAATPGEAVEGAVEGATESASAPAATSAIPSAADAPPLPRPVLDAWKANKTLALLFVRDGGIDDRLVKAATDGLAGFRDAAVFVVPAAKISRYAAITEGVGVERVPALVVVTPKHLKKTVPTASVSYGFQSPQSVAQAVIDAGYKGPTVDYHP